MKFFERWKKKKRGKFEIGGCLQDPDPDPDPDPAAGETQSSIFVPEISAQSPEPKFHNKEDSLLRTLAGWLVGQTIVLKL